MRNRTRLGMMTDVRDGVCGTNGFGETGGLLCYLGLICEPAIVAAAVYSPGIQDHGIPIRSLGVVLS